ncbi:MAG TPA: methyltransferase domain-containing protein [Vicinamibacteria bacterium]|nr:methyltransferase domain-containing protein [Vicinamibacteria bacterium]
MAADPAARWLEALEKRHLKDLTFPEVRRALQALSSLYVERRGKLAEGAALEGAGKRAAFALYYGPLHFLLVRQIVRALGAATPRPARVVDLGCGTGAAGGALALEAGGAVVTAVDRNGWAVDETRWTLAQLGLPGSARKGAVPAVPDIGRRDAVVAAFTVNELPQAVRERLRDRLVAAAEAGARVLVVEPLARRALGWWPEWEEVFVGRGGRHDEWRFPADLPPLVARLDRAAGLDHRVLTGRSLYLPGVRSPTPPVSPPPAAPAPRR